MKYAGLKKLQGQRVNLWPRPRVAPTGWPAQMQWLVARVDQGLGIAELSAPSGHFKNLADVINHYEAAGNTLALDAQLIIDGNTIVVEPRPWGATTRRLRRVRRRRLLSTPPIAVARAPGTPLKDMLALVGVIAIGNAIMGP